MAIAPHVLVKVVAGALNVFLPWYRRGCCDVKDVCLCSCGERFPEELTMPPACPQSYTLPPRPKRNSSARLGG